MDTTYLNAAYRTLGAVHGGSDLYDGFNRGNWFQTVNGAYALTNGYQSFYSLGNATPYFNGVGGALGAVGGGSDLYYGINNGNWPQAAYGAYRLGTNGYQTVNTVSNLWDGSTAGTTGATNGAGVSAGASGVAAGVGLVYSGVQQGGTEGNAKIAGGAVAAGAALAEVPVVGQVIVGGFAVYDGFQQGGVTGGLEGAAGGAIAGAAIGTVIVPGVGTVIGAAVGALVGGLVDGLFGGSDSPEDQLGGHLTNIHDDEVDAYKQLGYSDNEANRLALNDTAEKNNALTQINKLPQNQRDSVLQQINDKFDNNENVQGDLENALDDLHGAYADKYGDDAADRIFGKDFDSHKLAVLIELRARKSGMSLDQQTAFLKQFNQQLQQETDGISSGSSSQDSENLMAALLVQQEMNMLQQQQQNTTQLFAGSGTLWGGSGNTQGKSVTDGTNSLVG